MFLTHHNLQGSQTGATAIATATAFLTHHNLQGSQTPTLEVFSFLVFLTHHNLQGSQTMHAVTTQKNGFLPIIIYKVLKLLYRFTFRR